MFADFFIRRPIFSTVIAVIMILAGLAAVPLLPVAQYPQIAPPQVTVNSNYIGASSEVVESAVTTPLEQQINGVEGIKYMTSSSGNDGTSNITVVFNQERNLDLAAVDVQNRVTTALARLPNEVKNTGVIVSKNSSSLVLVIGLYNPTGEYTPLFTSNFADRTIKDALKRVKGVSDVTIFGERKYAMRLWLDPGKLNARGLTGLDVVNALREQNVQVAAGQLGQAPIAEAQAHQISLRAVGRLQSPEDFGNIILKSSTSGGQVKVKDVGRVELGAENYATNLRFNGKEAVGIGVYQLPNANAINLVRDVKDTMAKLEGNFPPNLKAYVILDTTLVIQESLQEVFFTLILAILLVVGVMYLFLQNWRATLIPAITIPVSLVGSFAFMKVFGFSINTLTMFGLTLATGLVVDDAIVVIENIERVMAEKKCSPLDAAIESMREVSIALIAISLVLIAVFVPVAFYPGTTGQLYRQFALTITFAITLSTINALTFTPALSAVLLKNTNDHAATAKNRFFKGVDAVIQSSRSLYNRSLDWVLKGKLVVVGVFATLLLVTVGLFQLVPHGFVPNEDQSYFIINVQAPEGVSIHYTSKILAKINALTKNVPEIRGVTSISGFSFFGNGPNKAVAFVALKPLHERRGRDHSAAMVINRLRGPLFAAIPEAIVMPFEPPAIQGMGRFGGVQMEIKDEGGHTLEELGGATWQLIGAASKNPKLTGLFSAFNTNTPQLKITVNREQAKALGIELTDIFSTLQVFLGSVYVNDFDFLNQVYRVYAQADGHYRQTPTDVKGYYVRSREGAMVPLSNLIEIERTYGPQTITHFNLYRSAEVNGSAAPGISTGVAIDELKQLAKEVLPRGMSIDWAGVTLEEIESGSQAWVVFVISLVFVYLVLAALYESWVDPLIILFAVPLAVLGAMGAQFLRGLENDVFCQIGLVMLIGMASKNSILIVEFANQLKAEGMEITRAAIEAAKTRFRPIVMTSLAFITGLIPLVVATGAGSAARNSMGTAVLGGMLVSTLLSLLVVPVFYILLNQLRARTLRQNA